MNVFTVLCSDWLVRVYDAGWQRLCWIFLRMSCGRKGVLWLKNAVFQFSIMFWTHGWWWTSAVFGSVKWVMWRGMVWCQSLDLDMVDRVPSNTDSGLDSGLGLDLCTVDWRGSPGTLIPDSGLAHISQTRTLGCNWVPLRSGLWTVWVPLRPTLRSSYQVFRLRTDWVLLWPKLFSSCLTGLFSEQTSGLTWLT